MDFSYLLEIAKQNSDEAGKKATVKRYSTNLKPPKREAKGDVKSGAIKAFLARKEEEEKQKEVEAKQKKSELLSLRSQNTKNSKKAKLMVSRTKDNDYSKIKITDEEEQMRKQRETELQRRMLTDKIERMKARIELQEKEKMLPRRRKRKAHLKNDVTNEKSIPLKMDEKDFSDDAELCRISNQTIIEPKRKVPLSAPPPMNFHDLLKLASKKQHEPLPAPKIEKKEERPMTQKERRLHEEQQLRKKGISVYSLPQPTSKKKAKVNSENNGKQKQNNYDSYGGQADQKQHIKGTNNANLSEKTISANNQRIAFHKENSQHLVNKAMSGHASKLKNDLPMKHSRYSDDEDDDDDLADFIDDGPTEEEIDFSSQIEQIFKYDRNRYIDDDDDDITETSFAEQMKEECRSAKIGREEDMEDMRKEDEDRKRKLMMLKKKNAR